MRIRTLMASIGLATAMLAAPLASAQGLGGLVNKAKKTVEKVDKVLNPKTEKQTGVQEAPESNVRNVLTGSGISMTNPLAESLEVEPLGLVGIPTSDTMGTAYLVLKVKNLLPDVASVLFGSSTDPRDRMIASDGDGGILQVDASGGYRYDTPADITVKIELSDQGLHFLDVPRNLEKMEMVRLNIVMNGSHRGNLTLKNVPITWVEEEEEEEN